MKLNKSISLGEVASISLPSFASVRFDAESEAFIVGLPGQDAALNNSLLTEIRISEISNPRTPGLDEADLVVDLASRFLVDYAKVDSLNISVSEDNKVCLAQGVGFVEEQRCWIVRMLCRRSAATVWMLHWNGPEAVAVETVLPILESFTLTSNERTR